MRVIVNRTKASFDLKDNDFIASGGQGSVYKKDNIAFKIYNDIKHMIPLRKIEELGYITAGNVIKPEDIVCDKKTSNVIGYTMKYIKETSALCKLFTKQYRKDNNISPNQVLEIVRNIQDTVEHIHSKQCLIVDMNEMNFLIDKGHKVPYFIDVDSYQTKSFPANAIMDSIRDRLAKKFTELSDWFSFAVIAFQLYVGIHPYKGKHPDYKPREFTKRMDDGISVFDSKVTIPSVCQDFSVIPKAHMEWFKSIFIENKRSAPPKPDATINIAMVQKTIRSTANFDIKSMYKYNEPIKSIQFLNGIFYTFTDKAIYCGKSIFKDISNKKAFLCNLSPDPVLGIIDNGCVEIETDIPGKFAADKAMIYNGSIFCRNGASVYEVYAKNMGNKSAACSNPSQNLGTMNQMFSGVVISNFLDKCWAYAPLEDSGSFLGPIEELHGLRIINAKHSRGILVCIAEESGKYYRFRFKLCSKENKGILLDKEERDVDNINFIVLNNGVCIDVFSDQKIEISKDNQKRIITNPPIDSSMPLYTDGTSVYFTEDKEMFSISIKK